MNDPTLEDLLTVREHNSPVAKVGLLVTLYFRGGHAPEVKTAVADVIDDYWRLCGDKLRWTTVPPKFTWGPADGALKSTLRSRLVSAAPTDSWQFAVHGGETAAEASDYRIRGLGTRNWQGEMGKLSFVSASWPIDFFVDRGDHCVDTVLRWARALRPIHGYAGFGIIDANSSVIAAKHEPTVFSLAQHFPGLEVDYPVGHSLTCADGIKSVNWLTIVSESLLARLGGRDSLRRQLGPRIVVHEYPDGLLIQAGPRPQLGDHSRDRWPEPYVEVNAQLAPIRAERTNPFHHYGADRFDLAASMAWRRRFDGREPETSQA